MTSLNKIAGYIKVWGERKRGRSSTDLSIIVAQQSCQKVSIDMKITRYPDASGDQNKNMKMPVTQLKLINSTNMTAESINLKIMVFGNSSLPNDSEICLIQVKNLMKQHTHISENWKESILNAKRKRPKIPISDFKNFNLFFYSIIGSKYQK